VADVAAFDFDGTLTEGGSVFDFLAALVGRRQVTAASMALAPRLAQAALMGGTVADRTKEQLFQRVLAGIPVAQAESVAEQFARDHLNRHQRADVRARFEWHRDRGDRLVIVSASPELYLGEVGRALGADQVIATRLEVDADGHLTGRYDGANCRGEEKLTRLRQWIDTVAESDEGVGSAGADEGVGGPGGSTVWAYGNSRGDLRMLRAAEVGVNVGRLGRFGKLRGFPGLAATGPGVG
jgi:phosphatidylglycerophosphatase C